MLMNLMIGLPITLLCLALQAWLTFWSVRYYLQQPDPMPGQGLFAHIRPLLVVMIVMMLGNFVQIVIWGVLFIFLGEFSELYEAVYHSAVNFTSLGYGDIVMSKRWKLMGPLEAANGVLMFGMTSAALMAILQQLIKVELENRRAAIVVVMPATTASSVGTALPRLMALAMPTAALAQLPSDTFRIQAGWVLTSADSKLRVDGAGHRHRIRSPAARATST